jgi:serine/threonine protein kinase/nitrous oxidase accessory protein NosD
MKTSVNDANPKVCPSCGKPLPAGAPAGLCPACLLAQGMQTDAEISGGTTRFVPPPLDEITQLFPQLEVMSLLGAGGMGAVYKARQPALDRMVALKILPATGGGALSEERFNREARALARLSHPNIVAVHEFGRAGNLHFFLMEFVDGANLRQLQRSQLISPKQALQIIPQICDALQYAHDEGVVHRDIKPENVLLDRKGRVKIADFGLAKILGTDPEAGRLTVEGQVMGTPHYMAPEQVERPLAVDHRADIYSLGVVFYEMLTGDLPLGKFAPPSRKVHVDVRLDDVVLRALENDPERRYQNASDVKQGVETIADNAPATNAPDNRPRTPQGTVILQPGKSPGPTLSRVLLGMAAVLLALAGVYLMRRTSGTERRGWHVDQVATWAPQTAQMVARLPDGGRIEVVAVGDTRGGWWRPDGSPVTDTSFEIRNGPPKTGEGGTDILLRVADLPEGTSSPAVETDPAAGSSGGGDVYVDGRIDRTLQLVRYAWPADLGTATIRAAIGLGAWRTVSTHEPRSGRNTDQTKPNDPPWNATFHPPADAGGRLQVTMVFTPVDRYWETRVVAVDTLGGTRFFSQARTTPTDSSATWTCVFPDLTLAEVREFRTQVRPRYWIEFKDVKVKPAPAQTAPQVFSKTMELSFDECIDFDSGKTAGFPAAKPDANPLEGIGENAQWAHEQGFDAAVANSKLRILDVDVTPLNSEDWNTLNPSEVIDRLDQNSSRPRTLGPFKAGELPVTYGYRTRENGRGMLRILAFDPARPGATIQLKRIVRPGEKPVALAEQIEIEVEGVGTFPTIQAAIDAAPADGTVKIPKGTFAENLVITKPLTLLGSDAEKTVIKPAKPWREPAGDVMKTYMERLQAAKSGVELEKIQTEVAARIKKPLVRIQGAGRVTLVGIRFHEEGRPAQERLLPGGVIEAGKSTVIIKYCAIVGSPASGLVAGAGANVQMFGSLVAATWHKGIHAEPGSRVEVTDSDIRNCYYAGITAGRDTELSIRRCRISGAAWHGIRYDNTSPTIIDSMIFENSRSGIYASGNTKATVRGNIFFENGMSGMSCWYRNTDDIRGNTFSGNFREALAVLGEASPSISSNIFVGNNMAITQGFIGGAGESQVLGDLKLRANFFWDNATNLVAYRRAGDGNVSSVTTLPADSDSRIDDPGLLNPEERNFEFSPNSIAAKQGIGTARRIDFPGPFPIQLEERAMMPSGKDRRPAAWKRPASR